MRSLFYAILVFLLFPKNQFAQKGNPYKEIDSLLLSGSVLDHHAALQLLEKKYVKDSTSSAYWLIHAKTCERLYKTAKTLTSLNKAIQLNNKNADAYFEKARWVYDKENDIDGAITLLNQALSIEKKGEYYFYRGIYEQILQLQQKAMDDYDKAVVLGVKQTGLYRNFANLLFENNDPFKAMKIIDMAITLEPEESSNYITKGLIYGCMLDLEKMCSTMDLAYKKGYENKNDFYRIICQDKITKNKFRTLGDAFYLIGNFTYAINAYTKAMTIDKDSAVLYLNRGYCHYKLRAYGKAEADYLKSLTLAGPDKDLLFDNLSLLYFDLEKFDSSITYATKRIALNPKNHIAFLDRGIAYRKLKNYTKAEADFNTSLAIKPDFFRAFGYRGYLHLELNENQEAYADALRSIQINPEYGYGYLVLGQSKIALQKKDYCADLERAKKYGILEADKVLAAYCK